MKPKNDHPLDGPHTNDLCLMLSIVGNIIGFITKVIPMLFAYRAGKKSAQVDILENESEIVEKANEVERKIDRIHNDAVSEQLRKRWSQPK